MSANWRSAGHLRSLSRGARGRIILGLLLAVLFGYALARPLENPTSASLPRDRFLLSLAFFGPNAYANPTAPGSLRARMLNAFSFWHPLDPGMRRFLARHKAGAIFTLSAATRVEGLPPAYIERQRRAIADLRRSAGLDISWNLMEEWDQGGGHWVRQGRPRYTGKTRRQAHDSFTRYYLDDAPPLGTYLRQSPAERGCPLVAQTDYPVNALYAFEMGVDLCLLERGIDELGDLSTGIAFVRGAARQFGKRWGIDLSLWRTGNDSATQFDARGVLTGGWSPSYVRRHLYLSYLSGAELVQIEPAEYYDERGNLNPLGRVTQEFADFALRRHPDVGRPAVAMALMTHFYSGFDPKHWIYGQADAVWYGDIPYLDGDHMLNNFLKLAYPNHWLHGLTPRAPFANADGAPDPTSFKRFLRAGGDPRPYEPMGFTRWGDNVDIIADNAPLATLRHYKVIALVGNVVIDGTLREALRSWVQDGGILVVNVKQVTAADESLLGVRLSSIEVSGTRSTWLADGTVYAEPHFVSTRVTPTTATLLATSGVAEPLVTFNSLSQGQVILTTAHYLQTGKKDQLLRVGARLFDWLNDIHAPAHVAGTPIEYIVNRSPGKIIVSLINNSGGAWNGSVILTSPPASTFALKEYISDAAVPYSLSRGKVVVGATVPAYDLKVYALETR